jgi:hypothetical protein
MTRCHLGGIYPLIHFLSEFETVDSTLKRLKQSHAQLGVMEPMISVEAIFKPHQPLNECNQEFVKNQILKMELGSSVFPESNHWIQQASHKLEGFCDILYVNQPFVKPGEKRFLDTPNGLSAKRIKTDPNEKPVNVIEFQELRKQEENPDLDLSDTFSEKSFQASDGVDNSEESPKASPKASPASSKESPEKASPEKASPETEVLPKQEKLASVFVKAKTPNISKWRLYRKINPAHFDNEVSKVEQWYHVLQHYFDNRIMTLFIEQNGTVNEVPITLRVPRILDHRSDNESGRMEYMMRKIRELFSNEALWQA